MTTLTEHPTAPASMPKPSQTAGHKRGDIQGLRAVAVLLVVVAHLGVAGLSGGFIGVDVFFVISGFLITQLMIREVERSGRLSLVGFYSRRALRILPAALFVTTAILVAAATTQATSRLRTIAEDAAWSSLFAQNIHLIRVATDYFADQSASPFQHFWSLAVEEQFYLVWPLLALVLLPRAPRWLTASVVGLACAASLWWSVAQTSANPASAYFSSFTRAHELAIGVLLALVLSRVGSFPKWLTVVLGATGAALVLVSVLTVKEDGFPSLWALLPTLGAAALLAAGHSEVLGIGKVLAWRPFIWVGDISYSLYLWHWPVIIFGRGGLVPVAWPTPVRDLVCVAISFGLAWLSYEYVEKHFLGLRQTDFRGWRPLLLWPITLTLVAVVAVGGVGTKTVQDRIEAASAEAAGPLADPWHPSADHPGPSVIADGWPAQETEYQTKPIPSYSGAAEDWAATGSCGPTEDEHISICDYGDLTSETTIALVGNSHAQQLFDPIEAVAEKYGFHMVAMLKGGCWFGDQQLIEDEMIKGTATREQATQCGDWNAAVMAQLLTMKPTLVVAIGTWYTNTNSAAGQGERVPPSMQSAFGQLDAAGISQLLIRDTGRSQSHDNPVECLQTGGVASDCGHARADAFAEVNPLIAVTQGLQHAHQADLTQYFCDDTYCPAVIGNVLVYKDSTHISRSYSYLLAPYLEPYVLSALDMGGVDANSCLTTLGDTEWDKQVHRVTCAVAAMEEDAGVPESVANTEWAGDRYPNVVKFSEVIGPEMNVVASNELSGDKPVVALLGDSHMAHLLPSLEPAFEDMGYEVAPFVVTSCQLTDSEYIARGRLDRNDPCEVSIAERLDEIRALGPDLLVFSEVMNEFGQTETAAELQAVAQVLNGLAKKVVWISNTPFFDASVPACLGAPGASVKGCSIQDATKYHGELAALQGAAAGDVEVLDATPLFCTALACPAVIDDIAVMSDAQHLTLSFGRLIAPALIERISELSKIG